VSISRAAFERRFLCATFFHPMKESGKFAGFLKARICEAFKASNLPPQAYPPGMANFAQFFLKP